jgi:hypothetical protein
MAGSPNIPILNHWDSGEESLQDLEKDVLLKRGYVLVYPDPVRKPPKGSGLNKRATVTMHLGVAVAAFWSG